MSRRKSVLALVVASLGLQLERVRLQRVDPTAQIGQTEGLVLDAQGRAHVLKFDAGGDLEPGDLDLEVCDVGN